MRTVIALLFLLVSVPGYCHQFSTAYLNTELGGTQASGKLQLALFDLEQAVGLDSNGDGQLLWRELQSKHVAIDSYLRRHVQFSQGKQACETVFGGNWALDSHVNLAYLVVPLSVTCRGTGAGPLQLKYTALFAQSRQHKLLVSVRGLRQQRGENTGDTNGGMQVIDINKQTLTFDRASLGLWQSFRTYVAQGVLHIGMGIDHLLFLISLLLVCVVERRHGRWIAARNTKTIMVSTALIVTAFTVAHSITLSAVAFDLVTVPSRWVEVCIAASVIVAAVNNLYPVVVKLGWLSFAFGLVHGMGFASVLRELGLPAGQELVAVLAFNLGVEAGQLMIVSAVLPILITLRQFLWYRRYLLTSSSLLISVIATHWLIQRL
ncbi:HupE/UreJ family protein [Microbulbifer sp. SAOS-129_SWC]|uniref:HupE/UreJ family protein n=1 Tax=Microbulbifer sp. SAOS-129_SWC TaxID=3145235 RepID=UPI003217FEEA